MAKIQYIDKIDFEKYYYDEKLTFRQIAALVGCSTQTINRLSKTYDIKVRRSKLVNMSVVGQKFGKLRIISRTGNRVMCECECGVIFEKGVYDLKRPGIRMCTTCKNTVISNANWKGYNDISGDMWYTILARANKRNMEITITIEEIWELYINQNKKCALSDVDIYFSRARRTEASTASLDRIDSSKGYIKNNCQWVHKDINKMKMDLPNELFINWCKLVSSTKQ